MSATQRQVYQNGIAFYRELLPAGALCFDVGANIGARSEELMEAGMRVVAFEPNSHVLPELRARCAHYGLERWTPIQAALGRQASIAILHARASHQQSGLIPDWEGLATMEQYPVPVITLDAAITQYGVPAYCKIDVEGYELEVLKGLSVPIPLLSFEFHLDVANVARTKACLEHLAGFGPARVNVAPAETPQLHWREWMSLEEFLGRFPGDLRRSMLYGDIFVQRDTV